LLLPRGKQYIPDPKLEVGWDKTLVISGNKSICVLQKFPSSTPKGIIILAHPYLSAAKQFFLAEGHADLYTALGCIVLVFDFNGFGESPFVNFNYAEDIKIVSDYIQSKQPEFQVFVHGISFGASHTITCATETIAFSKIIIENCLDSNLSYYKKRNLRLHYLMLGLMKIFPKVNADHDYIKTASIISGDRAVLLIYNEDDDLTTTAMGKQFLSSINVNVHLEIFKGKHLNAYKDNDYKYRKIIADFLAL
jgi:hypothetical protein